MGCCGSTPKGVDGCRANSFPKGVVCSDELVAIRQLLKGGNGKTLRKPKRWKHPEPITRAQLKRMRDEFWDTAPYYGGRKEIWDALQAATEADLTLAQAIIESAGIIVSSDDLSICYDETGAKYELPKYVLSDPINLIKDEQT